MYICVCVCVSVFPSHTSPQSHEEFGEYVSQESRTCTDKIRPDHGLKTPPPHSSHTLTYAHTTSNRSGSTDRAQSDAQPARPRARTVRVANDAIILFDKPLAVGNYSGCCSWCVCVCSSLVREREQRRWGTCVMTRRALVRPMRRGARAAFAREISPCGV